jgi:hypothetical protein
LLIYLQRLIKPRHEDRESDTQPLSGVENQGNVYGNHSDGLRVAPAMKSEWARDGRPQLKWGMVIQKPNEIAGFARRTCVAQRNQNRKKVGKTNFGT